MKTAVYLGCKTVIMPHVRTIVFNLGVSIGNEAREFEHESEHVSCQKPECAPEHRKVKKRTHFG